MLSGERSSGEMQDGLSGLLGLSLKWHGLYNPYPMKKNSMGINIACGCSSVTIDPQAWTCTNNTYFNIHALPTIMHIYSSFPRLNQKNNMWLGHCEIGILDLSSTITNADYNTYSGRTSYIVSKDQSISKKVPADMVGGHWTLAKILSGPPINKSWNTLLSGSLIVCICIIHIFLDTLCNTYLN